MAEELGSILVVEDEDDIRETLCEFLTHAGYTPLSAKNGQDAIERLRSTSPPEAILMDMMMPVMGGGEFLETLAQSTEWRSIPVLVMTATTVKSPPPNVVALIRKPFRFSQVLVHLTKIGASQDAF